MIAFLRSLILIFSTLLLLPFLLLLTAAILLRNLIHCLANCTRKPMRRTESPLSGLASIIILNWNGKELLKQECLPFLKPSVRMEGA